ncbi:MAG: hypothetical protein ACYTG3_04790 [Planctomycetota bacterium]|jgi:hypothetical protein
MDASVAEYLAAVPTDEQTARRAVAPYLRLTPAERWAAFAALQAEMDVLLNGRAPWRDDRFEPLWRHWKDPSLGRPD